MNVDMNKTEGDKWVPPSERIGDDAEPLTNSIVSKFEKKMSQGTPEPKKEVAMPEPKAKDNIPKVKVVDSLHKNNLFSIQQSTIAAEEAHLMSCEAEGAAHTKMHPSQLDTDEGDDDKIPSWRMKEVKAKEREQFNTYDLPERQAQRVREKAKEKKAAERAVKDLIAKGLPTLEIGGSSSNLLAPPDNNFLAPPKPKKVYPDDGM
eukprot:m.338771 g.338771  ORF g.338771 m.338771 type:complete len:205 (-) comp18539_c0_seq1:156-770(-)